MGSRALATLAAAAAAIAAGVPLPNVGPTEKLSAGTCECGGKLRAASDGSKSYCTTCGRLFKEWEAGAK